MNTSRARGAPLFEQVARLCEAVMGAGWLLRTSQNFYACQARSLAAPVHKCLIAVAQQSGNDPLWGGRVLVASAMC